MELHTMRLRTKKYNKTGNKQGPRVTRAKKRDLHKAKGILDAVHSKALSKDDTHECSNPTEKKVNHKQYSKGHMNQVETIRHQLKLM